MILDHQKLRILKILLIVFKQTKPGKNLQRLSSFKRKILKTSVSINLTLKASKTKVLSVLKVRSYLGVIC